MNNFFLNDFILDSYYKLGGKLGGKIGSKL